MSDIKSEITRLAELMSEYGLEEARLSGEDWSVAFSRWPHEESEGEDARPLPHRPAAAGPPPSQPPANLGIPVSSPMMGIYYASPSPGSPPFVKEGDQVTAGQVVGLIEAMKVFNEIIAPTSGSVTKIAAENLQLVQPGDPLLYIG